MDDILHQKLPNSTSNVSQRARYPPTGMSRTHQLRISLEIRFSRNKLTLILCIIFHWNFLLALHINNESTCSVGSLLFHVRGIFACRHPVRQIGITDRPWCPPLGLYVFFFFAVSLPLTQ